MLLVAGNKIWEANGTRRDFFFLRWFPRDPKKLGIRLSGSIRWTKVRVEKAYYSNDPKITLDNAIIEHLNLKSSAVLYLGKVFLIESI